MYSYKISDLDKIPINRSSRVQVQEGKLETRLQTLDKPIKEV